MTDLVERQAVLDAIHLFFTEEIDKIPTKKTEDGEVYVIHKCQPLFEMNKTICKRIKALPSVTLTERTGHWITGRSTYFDIEVYCCSECKRWFAYKAEKCPNCHIRMTKTQESEVQQ